MVRRAVALISALTVIMSVTTTRVLAASASRSVSVSLSDKPVALPHFWRSCGWCPPDPHPQFQDFFLTEDQWQNHALIGSVPYEGIKYVRIHYLLDLIHWIPSSQVPGGTSNTNFTIYTDGYLSGKALNWTDLDLSMDIVISNGLFPGFEVMGNPNETLFTSFKKQDQLEAWSDMMTDLANRYIKRYGLNNVRQWRFESWNEPDGECKHDLTVGITCDLKSFLAYFDATSYGLRRADSELIFGGPASDGDHEFLFGLIEHCTSGVHHITGEPGCGRVDFFNAHLKGDSDAIGILTKELPVAEQAYKMTRGTAYANVSWGNDEADPLVGWNKIEDWRADARYPGMVVKAINQHISAFVVNSTFPGLSYDVLSNDNGFLPYADNHDHVFTQRTLVARFAMNKTNTVESIRKPVLNVMALLALLGDTFHDTVQGAGPTTDDVIGVIPTTNSNAQTPSWEGALLLYASEDSNNATDSFDVDLKVTGLPSRGNISFGAWLIDQSHANAHSTWVSQGQPVYPSSTQFAAMRQAMEVPMLSGYPTTISAPSSGTWSTSVTLNQPAVVLFQMCVMAAQPPAAVSSVRLHRTPTASPVEIIVQWNEPTSRCIRTFSVEYAPSTSGPFQRVNPDTLFTTFIHALPGGKNTGCYRVSVIDLAGRSSSVSPVVCV